jgi:hypothetical protein
MESNQSPDNKETAPLDLSTAIKALRKAKGMINKSARIGSNDDWNAAIDLYCDAWDDVIDALVGAHGREELPLEFK